MNKCLTHLNHVNAPKRICKGPFVQSLRHFWKRQQKVLTQSGEIIVGAEKDFSAFHISQDGHPGILISMRLPRTAQHFPYYTERQSSAAQTLHTILA